MIEIGVFPAHEFIELSLHVCTYCCALQVRNGHIKRITDNDIQSLVIELYGTNVRFV